jgi:LmbE family N-acetylglucosaminyl deacetylase
MLSSPAFLITVVALATAGSEFTQTPSRTLVAVFAHSDDEDSTTPILARYAREGAQVYIILATDGSQGGSNTSIPKGPELARVRSDEARCAAEALGIHPPILLGFPDGALGNYNADPTLLYRLTARLHEELQRLRPDALITWGPDGGTGHPDHRLVSSIVTQLVRAGAPGVPERLFYSSLPAEGIQGMNPVRGVPPLLIPQPRFFTVRVSFTAADFEAAHRSMSCQRSQFTEDAVKRVLEMAQKVLNGVVSFSTLLPTTETTDLFSAPQ